MIFAHKPPPYSEPGSCLILPGKRSDVDGGIQLQTQLDGIKGPIIGWLSFTGLRQIAARHQSLGLVPAAELAAAEDALATAEAELAQVTAERDELRATEERIMGLKKAGFHIQRQPGRAKATS